MIYYRFFPEKYRLATRHLTAFQDGCYRRLIDEYMTTRRPLPDNDIALAGICRVSLDDWLGLARGIVGAFFEQKNGLLFQENCDAELDWQDGKSKIATEKGQKGAAARHSKNKDLPSTGKPQAKLDTARVKSKELNKEAKASLLENEKSGDENKPEDLKNEGKDHDGKQPKPKSKPKNTPLSDDWKPHDGHIAKCTGFGFAFDELADEFRNYHTAKGTTFANWDAAFFTWIGNAKKFSKGNESRGSFGRRQPASVVDAALRAAAKAEQNSQ